MSIRPNSALVSATSASTWSLREMLQAMTLAMPPLARMPAATGSHASALRLEITSLAPRPAMVSAIERPMPRLEPVTIATLPVRSNGVDMVSLLLLNELPGAIGQGDAARADLAGLGVGCVAGLGARQYAFQDDGQTEQREGEVER